MRFIFSSKDRPVCIIQMIFSGTNDYFLFNESNSTNAYSLSGGCGFPDYSDYTTLSAESLIATSKSTMSNALLQIIRTVQKSPIVGNIEF